jgi:tRNA-splicing ligase RtcB (3'-phosphate/5'-hydroxy nucleic acid ligase)
MKPDTLQQINEYIYEIPKSYRAGMRVPARIYASKKLISGMDDAVFQQLTNVAMLPGIVSHALCMPDGHSGYGFPIGGVAVIDPDEGVISPGGIGFDINCGVRLMTTSLTLAEVQPLLHTIVDTMFARIPSGVGGEGSLRLSPDRLDEAMILGAAWAVKNGYGNMEDLEYTEEYGCMKDADPSCVSAKAKERGKGQMGTLGSGNHYLEVQVARKENVYDPELARIFGITKPDQIVIMIHSGSRALGHQIATDYLKRFASVMQSRYKISLPDRELSCAPFYSVDGQNYYKAMNCAINFAFLNRQLIMHHVREVFSGIFKKSPEELGMNLIYDVCHNTAKREGHVIQGKKQEFLVHRKGATRAFSQGKEGLPEKYMASGQPVIIGGSMETASYLLTGMPGAEGAFYTNAHGSGRMLSRHKAKQLQSGRDLQKRLIASGIYIQTSSHAGLAEEAGAAYKDIDEVVRVSHRSGLSKPVVKLLPIGNIKG